MKNTVFLFSLFVGSTSFANEITMNEFQYALVGMQTCTAMAEYANNNGFDDYDYVRCVTGSNNNPAVITAAGDILVQASDSQSSAFLDSGKQLSCDITFERPNPEIIIKSVECKILSIAKLKK